MHAAARAWADLIKRFKGSEGGGLVPKSFVTDFLWTASVAAYSEERLRPFLAPDSMDLWKAIRKHMVQVCVGGGGVWGVCVCVYACACVCVCVCVCVSAICKRVERVSQLMTPA